ncbi:MAG TPA: metalloregulator ArsR/SmtB family transcription factor [Saprospiraceae bacterium]|nr:metalloregulator ArsR/SmtB family transcription factor [Saprospiraceae bacterium]HMQ84858.1 metalloregulator ArsR/SmtB family transcription factor [Saprospiraceae bacterium]
MDLRRDVFQAIADPTRRDILSMIAATALTPGTIAEHFGSTRQTISRHIQILTECELLTATQKGREIHYQLNPVKMKEVADFIEPFRQMWEAQFQRMDAILENLTQKK